MEYGGIIELELYPDIAPITCANFEELVKKKFYKGSSSVRGTGIGLAIVQAAAHAHGGEASVQSGPDGGCTFTVTIPVRA